MSTWEYLAQYEDYLKLKDKSQCTIDKYRQLVQQMLRKIDKEPMKITQQDMDGYKLYMKDIYHVNSLGPHASAINQFFAMLGKDDISIKAPNRKRKNVVPLTEREIEKMLAASYDDPMDYAILTTLYYGQLRESELIALNIPDIDFERQKLRVNSGKGDRSDEINMHPIALKAIERYINTTRICPNDGSDMLFVSIKGLRLSRTPVWTRVKKYAVKAGINKRVYPHLFRHSCITHMSDNGASLAEIQKQSRHRDIKTLMSYIHPSEQRARDVYMRTLGGSKAMAYNEMIPEDHQPGTENRELLLLDALCAGRISEETYKQALETLKNTKPQPLPEEDLRYIG